MEKDIEVKFNPPLKKKEFLNWMDENLPMPKDKTLPEEVQGR